MEGGRGNRGKRRGENRRKRREKVMEEAVVTRILQPTGRKLVRCKHTKDVETGESSLAQKGLLQKKGQGHFQEALNMSVFHLESVLWLSDHCSTMKRTLLQSK